MFDRIKNFIGGIKSRMGLNKIDLFDKAASSAEMESRIDLWKKLYCGDVPWLGASHGHTLGLPAAIASEIARLVTLEMKVDIVGENERAKYLAEQFEPVKGKLRRYVEYGCACGGLMFKPYLHGKKDDGNIAIDIVQADKFYPIAYDSKGDIVSAAFVEDKIIQDTKYSRIEKHIKTPTGYTITNECSKGMPGSSIGTVCPLSEVPEWAELEPTVNITGIDHPLFAYFSIPQGNTEEPTSPLGVSVYARAVNQIKEADILYDLLLWEYEGSALAVNASTDAFAKDKYNNVRLPDGRERLYIQNEIPLESDQKLLETFAPELRDEAYKRGLNEILRVIETNCGLAWGTLSDANLEAKTATEIKMNKQRSYSTVTDIQKSLQNALDALIVAIDEFANLYKLAPSGEYETSYVWDDSIVVDAEAERARDLQEVTAGLMAKWEYRVKWYGEDEETARKNIEDNRQPTDNEIMGFGGTLA